MAIIRAQGFELKETGKLSEKRRYNSDKNKEETLKQEIVLSSYPRRLFLEMTSACNINCIMCGRNATTFKPTMFNYKWLDLLEGAAEYAEEVTLMGWGEPTMHPEFSNFLRWGYERGLRKYFCTNGMNLDKLFEDIFNYETELITVSLDGKDERTNDEIRRGSSFRQITNSIKRISREKEILGKSYPYLTIVITLMERNYKQLPDMVELAHELNVPEVKCVYFTLFDDKLKREVLVDRQDDIRRVFSDAADKAEKYNIYLKLPYIQGEDPACDQEHKDCYLPWRDFYLGSDGYVRPCMHTAEEMFSINKYLTFDEMWNSSEYRYLRSVINNKEMSISCKNCYHATQGNWNKRSCFIQTGNVFAPDWR